MKNNKTVKPGIALVLALCLVLTFAACGAALPVLTGISIEDGITLTAGESLALAPDFEFDRELGAEARQEALQRLALSFTSSNGEVATVSALGEVTALARGVAKITLAAGEIDARVTVTVLPRLEGLATVAQLNLIEGESSILIVAAEPADAVLGELAFSSGDESVATVSPAGEVTAVGCGETSILVKSGDIEREVAVAVAHRIEGLALDAAEGVLAAGQSLQLTASFEPEDARAELVWASSDDAVATVEDGMVEALAEGEAVITVSIAGQAEVFAEYRLTVTAAGGGNTAGQAAAGGAAKGSSGAAAGTPGQNTGATGGDVAPPSGSTGSTGGAGDPNYFYCEICDTYHRKGVLAACGRGHSTIGTDCTWVLRDAYEATCYENRLEIYDCAENCGMCYLKTIENSTIPCEFTRLIDAYVDGEIVQKYCCRMCGAMAP